MRLLVAILVSASLHAAVILVSPDVKPLHSSAVSNVDFQVTLKHKTIPNKKTEQKSRLETPIKSGSHLEENSLPQSEGAVNHDNDFKGYWSTSDTERKALPISNIDLSMINGQFVSGLPISLRIFISEFGRVTKIEKMNVLPQDEDFARRIEDLLYELTFIPAKKDGVDVASYQEVEFSFNSSAK